MRSRFTAFARGDAEYLMYSWHPSYRPDSLSLSAGRVWTSLEIGRVSGGQVSDDVGEVSFIARFLDRGIEGAVVEHSYFQRLDGRWVYLYGAHSN